MLDTGTVGIGNTTQNVCPYSILVFDLETDQLLRRYTLRTQDTNANTFIANIAVDIGRTCDDAYLYASDELGYGLIVYSWRLDTSWRVQHGYFLPDPLKGECASSREGEGLAYVESNRHGKERRTEFLASFTTRATGFVFIMVAACL